MNNDGLFQVNANFTFGGAITGNALADFLTGNASTLKQGNGQLGRDSQNMPALFFQDNWKVSRTLQINAGLRWDPFIPQYTKYKQASDFNMTNYYAGTISSVYPNAPPGVTFPGDTGFNEKSDTNAHIWDFLLVSELCGIRAVMAAKRSAQVTAFSTIERACGIQCISC